MTTIDTKIERYLKNNHVGVVNAIHSKDLAAEFMITQRRLRTIINNLRRNGVAICSNDKGYFYASCQREIEETIGRLSGYVSAISHSRTGLLCSFSADNAN